MIWLDTERMIEQISSHGYLIECAMERSTVILLQKQKRAHINFDRRAIERKGERKEG